MCEPVTISLMVVSAISAVQAQRAQNASARAQYANQAAAAQNNVQRILFNQQQINKGAASEMFDTAREAAKGRSAAIAAAAGAGLQGNTITSIFGETYFNEGLNLARIASNAAAAQQNLQYGGMDANTAIQSQINQVKTVSNLEVASAIAGNVLSQDLRRPQGGSPYGSEEFADD